MILASIEKESKTMIFDKEGGTPVGGFGISTERGDEICDEVRDWALKHDTLGDFISVVNRYEGKEQYFACMVVGGAVARMSA